MKKIILSIFFSLALTTPVYAQEAYTQGGNPISPTQGVLQQTNLTYTPLEPLPGLAQYETGNSNFGQLLSMAFKLLIVLAALIAVGSFVYAGISYMVSDVPLVKFSASKRLQAAFLGLAILLGSWLILFTINPQLVMFSSALNPTNGYQPVTTGGTGSTEPIVTTNNGTSIPVITASGQDVVIQNAKNNPTDAAAQAAAAAVVQQREASCTSNYGGVIAPANNPCTQDVTEHYLGNKIYNSCATITTPTRIESCYYNR